MPPPPSDYHAGTHAGRSPPLPEKPLAHEFVIVILQPGYRTHSL
ncbi:hypothetical protein Isop_2483 [Isosphaera pallida ATCC 43644]|jgi:hypothetical protein|uniref:Uncharacterized protein n=1 Tax=Isosphaera pallida (strain ATCC 43644 / DSM 9630 / IS1B) TaxID=575540 RepID=E8QXK7_ISOPI|nr:hypothetical protein Isop_2483 [Isosphaera pallida ATCC 43644]